VESLELMQDSGFTIHEGFFLNHESCTVNLFPAMDILRNYFNFYKKELVFAGIIVLTASLSFGLGYLAAREFNHASIIIEKCSSSRGMQ
jgi:hypothetical protein